MQFESLLSSLGRFWAFCQILCTIVLSVLTWIVVCSTAQKEGGFSKKEGWREGGRANLMYIPCLL